MNYRVYADGDLIYDTSVDTQELQLISPVLTKEVSCAGSFECTIPTTHFFYNNIKRFNTKIFVYRNDEEFPYWDGRVFDESTDIYNNRNVYCEGALSYFNDTHQPQREYKAMTCHQVLEAIISIHNSKVDAIRQFGVGIAPVVFNPDEYFYTQYESSLDAINKLAEEFDCEIRVRWGVDQITGNPVRYIDFIKEFTDVSTQQIIFGENLLDFTRSYDMSNLVTVLLPLGKMEASDSTRNRNLGNEVSDDEFDVVFPTEEDIHNHITRAWIKVDYEVDGEMMEKVEDTVINCVTGYDPVTGDPIISPYLSGYKAKSFFVNPGDVYYLTSRMQKGQKYDEHGNEVTYIFYAICRLINGVPIIYSSKDLSTGTGTEDLKEEKIEIPNTGGDWYLYICGNTYDYPFVLYRDKELPDKFNDYFTAEKANNSSLYIKAVPREVTTYDEDGNPTTITVDPLEEWGYVEKSIEFEIPESVLDNYAQGEEAYSTLSEKREYRASAYLVRKANEYLTDYQFDSMQLEVNAVDLSYLGVNVGAIDIFMNIRAISPKHGLNRLFPVNKAIYHLDSPSSDTYSLGTKEDRNLTAVNNAIDSELFAKITEVPSTSSVLAAAQQNAAQSLNMGKSGYVSIIDKDGKVLVSGAQLYISKEEDFQQTGKYWVYNSNGWGYTNDGGQNVLGAATISQDASGNIGVAMNATYITTGSMYADMIRGKTLTLGSYESVTPRGEVVPVPGDLRVLDSNGDTVFSVDQYNITFKSGYAVDNFKRWTEYEQGEINGYYYDPTTDDTYLVSKIGPSMRGQGFNGIYMWSNDTVIISADNQIIINSDDPIQVEKGNGEGAPVGVTITDEITVGGKRLKFIHGMLVDVNDDEPEPEPEEE